MNKRALFALVIVFSSLLACKKNRFEPEQIRQLLTYRSLGLAYLEEGRFNEAKTEFEKIIQLAPEEALGYANVALSYLRLGNYTSAETQALKALETSSEPDVALILAEVYEKSGKTSQAVKVLQTSIQSYPNYPRTQYKLGQLLLREAPPDFKTAENHFSKTVELLPANIAAKLQLIEVLFRNGKTDRAAAELELIRRQVVNLPEGALPYYTSALEFARDHKTDDASVPATAFQNFMKPTPLYQASVQELTGPGGSIIGFPIVHFSPKISERLTTAEKMQAIGFVNVTQTAGLPVSADQISFGDFDSDGDPDMFVSGSGKLLRNEKGRFQDVSATTGLTNTAGCRSAIFQDFTNDFADDLLLVCADGIRTLQNQRGSKFVNMDRARISQKSMNTAVLVDLDIEGDLDVLLVGNGGSKSYRNNSDGTFLDITDSTKLGSPATVAVYGDFDDDGDLDIVFANERGPVVLYDNLRQGQYANIAGKAGLGTFSNHKAATVGDYDNDGFLDLFLAGQHSQLLRNQGNGTFQLQKELAELNSTSAQFFDFDNDGRLDLILAANGKARLFRNAGANHWEDVSSILPATDSQTLVNADYDSDGDLDIFSIGPKSKVSLLRNDGGNLNRWVKMKLQGLGSGSGKNNVQGIGAKLEIKAGDLYQLRVANHELIHFGLGSNTKADVVRIVWTNGVPQNHFHPVTNQVIVEKQILKGSCAFLYAWNGKKYTFVTDVLWKSALGMPLGIMAGTTAYAFADSTNEYLRIAGKTVEPRDGKYIFQITEELWETSYFDKVHLVAVDHPSDSEVFINEQFSPPPYPPLRYYFIRNKFSPVSAVDEAGRNLLENVRKLDDRYAAHLAPTKYQGIMEMHDLILDLGKLPPKSPVVLFLNGWLFPSDASINVAVSQSTITKSAGPILEVADKNGKWKEVPGALSFPMGKNKTAIVDLAGKFPSENYKIRIRTNLQIYWNHIFFAFRESSQEIHATELRVASADLHYRGFSRLYRNNFYGPHLFDYENVETQPIWRDLEGYYTRYGDVTPLLHESDDEYVMMNAGDEMTLTFSTGDAPPLPSGWKRDFLIYTDGWIKDGDLNTAHSKTVDPLPFHAMPSYPYPPTVSYPSAKHADYLKKYNTRLVTAKPFRKSTATQ